MGFCGGQPVTAYAPGRWRLVAFGLFGYFGKDVGIELIEMFVYGLFQCDVGREQSGKIGGPAQELSIFGCVRDDAFPDGECLRIFIIRCEAERPGGRKRERMPDFLDVNGIRCEKRLRQIQLGPELLLDRRDINNMFILTAALKAHKTAWVPADELDERFKKRIPVGVGSGFAEFDGVGDRDFGRDVRRPGNLPAGKGARIQEKESGHNQKKKPSVHADFNTIKLTKTIHHG